MALLTPSVQAQQTRNAALTIIAVAALIALLYYGKAFFVTLMVSVILAFMLEPFVGFFMKLRLPRGLASFLVCSLAVLVIYLAGLGVYTQVVSFWEDLPAYSERINYLVDTVALKLENMEQTAYQMLVPKRLHPPEQAAQPSPPPPANAAARRRRSAEPPTPPAIQEVRIRQERTPLINYVYSYAGRFYIPLLLASFIPFLVYFMLSWRDHMRHTYLQLFQGSDRHAASKSWEGIASLARAYVVGNFILGLLLTLASSLFFHLVKLPYPLLIGPLSGFLSLVPYAGLPLAMIPPLFAALPVHKTLAWYLIIGGVVAFFHLLALNLLYPKLVGSRVHLNPLVVTVALMFWGVLWGGAGLVLAIPITAGIKAVCDNVARLQPYGKFLGD